MSQGGGPAFDPESRINIETVFLSLLLAVRGGGQDSETVRPLRPCIVAFPCQHHVYITCIVAFTPCTLRALLHFLANTFDVHYVHCCIYTMYITCIVAFTPCTLRALLHFLANTINVHYVHCCIYTMYITCIVAITPCTLRALLHFLAKTIDVH